MSPLVTALSPLRHRAEKRAKGLEKRNQLRGFGLRANILSTEVGNPTSLHTESFQLPGAGLARAWCCLSVNPVVSAGLLRSILLSAQDCFNQSCRQRRIVPAHYQQLVLGAVLARAQPRGPAVKLPGLRHVVYAQDKGQAACEKSVLSGRPGHAPASSCHSSSCCDLGRCSLSGCLGEAERVDRPEHPGIARSHLWAAVADAARCSAPVAAAV